jgi:hypothetical protein
LTEQLQVHNVVQDAINSNNMVLASARKGSGFSFKELTGIGPRGTFSASSAEHFRAGIQHRHLQYPVWYQPLNHLADQTRASAYIQYEQLCTLRRNRTDKGLPNGLKPLKHVNVSAVVTLGLRGMECPIHCPIELLRRDLDPMSKH